MWLKCSNLRGSCWAECLPLSLLADLILEKGFQQEDVYIYNMFVVLKEAADVGDLKV